MINLKLLKNKYLILIPKTINVFKVILRLLFMGLTKENKEEYENLLSIVKERGIRRTPNTKKVLDFFFNKGDYMFVVGVIPTGINRDLTKDVYKNIAKNTKISYKNVRNICNKLEYANILKSKKGIHCLGSAEKEYGLSKFLTGDC